MNKQKFVIGTRGSELALWQAEHVKAGLEAAHPDREFEIRIIHTTGDQVLDVALSKIGDKGLFTRQIESELLAGSIDMAVHSLKDLQTEQPEGLTVGAILQREVANDVFISKTAATIDGLPQGARVATGSLRRRSQLLAYRPDLEVVEIRGNVPTRLRKFDESDLDAMILAFAGVHRLDLDERITQTIPVEIMLPAVGQGAVAVEIRDADADVRDVVKTLDHMTTRVCVTAERTFLRTLEGGCQVPIGAHAIAKDGTLTLQGFVGSLNGSRSLRDEISGSDLNAAALGTELAERLIAKGAAELVAGSRETGDAAGVV